MIKGSDSAPHPIQSKTQNGPAAGCFTQGWTVSLVLSALEEGVRQGWIGKEDIKREALEGFLSNYGRDFYKISNVKGAANGKRRIRLERRGERVPESIKSADGQLEVVPFRRGQEIMSLSWIE